MFLWDTTSVGAITLFTILQRGPVLPDAVIMDKHAGQLLGVGSVFTTSQLLLCQDHARRSWTRKFNQRKLGLTETQKRWFHERLCRLMSAYCQLDWERTTVKVVGAYFR